MRLSIANVLIFSIKVPATKVVDKQILSYVFSTISAALKSDPTNEPISKSPRTTLRPDAQVQNETKVS